MNAAFCTISTLDHLNRVYALHESLFKHNDKAKLYVLIVDSDDKPIHKNIFFYNLGETLKYSKTIVDKYASHKDKLRWGLKPAFMQFLLSEKEQNIIYLDNDIYFFNNYNFILDIFSNNSIILCPHWRDIDTKGNFTCNLTNGIFNAGFVGASRNAIDFVIWWKKCCEYKIEKDLQSGLYDDQKYLDLVPTYFSGVHILRHRGCNVAFWNKNYNVRSQINGDIFIANEWPIIFIHFSKPLHIKNPNMSEIEPLLKRHFSIYEEALRRVVV